MWNIKTEKIQSYSGVFSGGDGATAAAGLTVKFWIIVALFCKLRFAIKP